MDNFLDSTDVSETSYAVIFTFSISNMSIPENPDLRNGTYTQVENIISNAVSVHDTCFIAVMPDLNLWDMDSPGKKKQQLFLSELF